jgi:hypothetical protein
MCLKNKSKQYVIDSSSMFLQVLAHSTGPPYGQLAAVETNQGSCLVPQVQAFLHPISFSSPQRTRLQHRWQSPTLGTLVSDVIVNPFSTSVLSCPHTLQYFSCIPCARYSQSYSKWCTYKDDQWYWPACFNELHLWQRHLALVTPKSAAIGARYT